MADNTKFGKKGEEMAARHLRKKGYNIVAVNWRFGKGEIDIVARKDDLVIFVEVKTRHTGYFGLPELAVDRKKRKQIIKTANEYLIGHDIHLESRFDIISIILNENEQQLEHIEDAFYPLA